MVNDCIEIPAVPDKPVDDYIIKHYKKALTTEESKAGKSWCGVALRGDYSDQTRNFEMISCEQCWHAMHAWNPKFWHTAHKWNG